MSNRTRSSVIEQLIGSYFELPVRVDWARASGLPFPDEFHDARLAFAGIATAWLPLDEVIWHAAHVRVVPGMPAEVQVSAPTVEIAVGRADLEHWLNRFRLPYRLELTADGLVVHAEIAGFPVARLDARLEVERGWFVLQPQRASVLGVPNYVAALFRTYLPLPPLAGDARLERIEHRPERLHLTFALPDFVESVTPGLLGRLQRRLAPTLAPPFTNPPGSSGQGTRRGSGGQG